MATTSTSSAPSGHPMQDDAESLRLLVQSVRDYAIFLLDPDGYIRSWNPGAERLKGYSPEEAIGQHFSIFYSREELEAGKPAEELRIAREQGRFEEEGWRLRKDGTRFWADVVLTALRHPDGSLAGFGKVTRDLTDRRTVQEALRQSEERFRLLLESVKDYAVFMLDPDGTVATWNAGAQRLKGYTPEEIVGRHFSVFYPPELAGAGHPEAELEKARTTGRYEEEGWRVRNDGSRFWANVVLTAVCDSGGVLRGFAKVTRDLTDRRLAEEERLRRAKADEAVRMRDEFLSLASHELRTPLTPLSLHLQGLERALLRGERPDPSLATKARRQTRRLTRLIDEMLDFARIHDGRLALDRERLDLDALVRQALDDLRTTDTEHVFVYTREPSPFFVRADAGRIEQVLLNLLQNAIKYSPDGRRVVVDLRVREGEAWLSVTDEGIGIPEEDRPHLFERFFRAGNARPRHFGGLGLGLYLSNEIVQRHGGRFEVVSTAGVGSTFRFCLPLGEEGGPEAKAVRARLLAIDDDPEIIDALRTFLVAEGYEVDSESNGQAALQRLRRDPHYDLLLLDLMMPDADGSAVVEQMRLEHLAPDLPIVVFSADPHVRERAGKLGVSGWLRKPIDLDELTAMVRRVTTPAA